MKNFVLLIIGTICFTINSILSAQQIIITPEMQNSNQTGAKPDNTLWQDNKGICIEKNGIKFDFKSCYRKENIFLNISFTPRKRLIRAQLELFIEPVITKNKPRKLVQKNLEYFTLTFNQSGVQAKSSNYDGKVVSNIKKEKNGGFSVELSLPVPENMVWLRIPPKQGEYYNIACKIKAHNLRHSLFFLTNHHDNLKKANMAKMLFCKGKIPANEYLFFDMYNVYKKPLAELSRHIEELRHLKAPNIADNIAAMVKNWKEQNQKFSKKDYRVQRYFQLHALKKMLKKAYKYHIKYIEKIATERSQRALLVPQACFDDSKFVLPNTLPSATQLGQSKLTLQVCPGETSALSALLWSEKTLRDVTFELSSFSGKGNKKVAASIDKFYVKCWYQAGNQDVTHTNKLLTPELLLKNPDLVQVDYLNENNLLQIHHNSSLTRLYPDDSKKLLPIKLLQPEFAQQLWVNVRFPENTKTGIYKSKLIVSDSAGKLAELPVEIKVLDFKLDRSPLQNYIYTYSKWGSKSDNLVLTEIRSLKDHGIDTVGISEKTRDLKRVVKLMNKGGLSTERIYLQGEGDHNFWSKMTKSRAEQRVKKVLKELEGIGVKEVYFYLPDEAKGKRLLKSIVIAKGIREAGGKTWGAAYRSWYDAAGKSFDHVNVSGPPAERKYVKMVHQDGHKIFCYNNPQGGVERPEMFRRNFGLRLWCADYDGGMTWSWWWPFGKEHDSWNDFDDNFWKDHCMVYPTRTGLVNTIQFEGYLKGVNDTRYLGTLLNLLKKTPANNSEVKKIKAYLNQMHDKDYLYLKDLNKVRQKLIKSIEICRKLQK